MAHISALQKSPNEDIHVDGKVLKERIQKKTPSLHNTTGFQYKKRVSVFLVPANPLSQVHVNPRGFVLVMTLVHVPWLPQGLIILSHGCVMVVYMKYHLCRCRVDVGTNKEGLFARTDRVIKNQVQHVELPLSTL